MPPLRRTFPEPRLELTPLIDVVFLLLTFFIFSLVVMIRADILDIRIPALAAARPAEPAQSITIALAADGAIAIDGQPVDKPALVETLRARLDAAATADPTSRPPRLLIAADTEGTSGDLMSLIDTLVAAGLPDFSLVAKPARQDP